MRGDSAMGRYPAWISASVAAFALCVVVMSATSEASHRQAANTAFLTPPAFNARTASTQQYSLRPSLRVANSIIMAAPVDKIDKRQERRRIVSSSNFNRKGFKEAEEEVQGMMVEEFTSDLVKELRENNFVLERENVVVKLAKSYGFCWGVERAVALAYEARTFYKNEKIHITNEIIHNPSVNTRLKQMDINFVGVKDGEKDFSNVQTGDVVILPAFGASLPEMQLLDKKGVKIVDTTCPWVSKVWNAVDTHTRKSMTSVIHGKWSHEESIATASFAETYIIVKDIHEAEYVADYIVNSGNKEEFLKKFQNAMSPGFDPDRDLEKVGIANQTTMYKEETAAIAKLFERTMMRKFGPQQVNEHFMSLDTICDATQERQDAITELLEDKSLDLVLVVGGFDSSNTGHLLEIAELKGVTAYHIDLASRIRPDGSIEHRHVDGRVEVTPKFLPAGKVTIGITSGASTPDATMQEVIEQVFLLKAVAA